MEIVQHNFSEEFYLCKMSLLSKNENISFDFLKKNRLFLYANRNKFVREKEAFVKTFRYKRETKNQFTNCVFPELVAKVFEPRRLQYLVDSGYTGSFMEYLESV